VHEGNDFDAARTHFDHSRLNSDRVQLSSFNQFDGFCDDRFGKFFAGSAQTIGQTLWAALLTAASFARTIAASAPWQQFGRGAAAPAKSFGEGGKWADRDGRASARSGFRLVFVVEG
jgi:hypothetical protein